MMFNLQRTMNLLLLVFPLIWFEATFGVRSEPNVITVEEGSDVILPCSLSSKNIEFTLFDWKKDGHQKEVFGYDSESHSNSGRPGQDEQFKGRVSHFEDGLKSGKASIKIKNMKVDDSGNYTCEFPQLQPRQIFHIELYVVGAARKPNVMIVDQTAKWALLQCEVRGAFPKPKLQWKDRAGNNLTAEEPKETVRGSSYDVILQTTVTKTDDYRCVATQEEINHQTDAKTFVYIHGSNVIKVEKGHDIILPCSHNSKKNIVSKVFVWKKEGHQKEVFGYDSGIHSNNGRPGQDEQFKGRVSHFEDGLKSRNADIIIRKTKLADRGVYTCEFPQLHPRQIFHIKLHVIDVINVGTGSDVILPCSLSSKENITSKLFDWRKDGQKVFGYDSGIHSNNSRPGQDEQFKGRVSHFPDGLKSGNASITIRNTKVDDSGNYICDFPQLQPRQIFHIELRVGAAQEPNVTIVNQTKDWTGLQCEVRSAFPKPKLHWEDRAGNILHAEEPKETERGGSYDVILQTNVTKIDYYSCVVAQEDINHYTDADIHVNISARKPNITTIKQTENEALLQCEFRGASPKPKLHWEDIGGKNLTPEEPKGTERGGSNDVILQITVTKTGYYRCVATQEDISYQTNEEIYVCSYIGLVVTIVVLCLFGLIGGVALAVLIWKGYITINGKKGYCIGWSVAVGLLVAVVVGVVDLVVLIWKGYITLNGTKIFCIGWSVGVALLVPGVGVVVLAVLKRKGYITLNGNEEPKVIIVKEGSDVILPCSLSSKKNIESKLFEWKKEGLLEVFVYDAGIHTNDGRPGQDEQFKGRVSHFEDELKSGNASIKIINIKMGDNGDYTCEFPQLQPRQIFHIKLCVDCILEDRTAENIPGAVRKPDIKILNHTENWALLQGEVRGAFPKPSLHWQDSDGNKLHAEKPKVTVRGGSDDVILRTIVTKTGDYRCVATQKEICHQIYAEIHVDIHNVITVEGSDVILPCSLSSKNNIESKLFDWKKDDQKVFVYDSGIHTNNGRPGQDEQFKGRVSHFEDGLKSGKASIKIKNTKVADSGNYTCEFPQLHPRQKFHIKLLVVGELKDRTDENIPGAAPEPNVTILDQTENRALLQCEVRGAFPKPKLHWQDSDRNILPAEEPKVTERGGSYDVILQTTVTKTDYYRCVATQEKFSHQINSEIHVYIHDSPPQTSRVPPEDSNHAEEEAFLDDPV